MGERVVPVTNKGEDRRESLAKLKRMTQAGHDAWERLVRRAGRRLHAYSRPLLARVMEMLLLVATFATNLQLLQPEVCDFPPRLLLPLALLDTELCCDSPSLAASQPMPDVAKRWMPAESGRRQAAWADGGELQVCCAHQRQTQRDAELPIHCCAPLHTVQFIPNSRGKSSTISPVASLIASDSLLLLLPFPPAFSLLLLLVLSSYRPSFCARASPFVRGSDASPSPPLGFAQLLVYTISSARIGLASLRQCVVHALVAQPLACRRPAPCHHVSRPQLTFSASVVSRLDANGLDPT